MLLDIFVKLFLQGPGEDEPLETVVFKYIHGELARDIISWFPFEIVLKSLFQPDHPYFELFYLLKIIRLTTI